MKFTEHIEEVKKKLAMQCGIASKLRHYVPKSVLLQFCSSNIKQIIQYGLLIYGCVNFNALQPLVLWQKNFLTHFVPEIHRKCNSFFREIQGFNCSRIAYLRTS